MTEAQIQAALLAAQAEFARAMKDTDGDLDAPEVERALRHLACAELTLELSTREW